MTVEEANYTPEEIDEIGQLRATVIELGRLAEERGIEIDELRKLIAELEKLAFEDPLLGIYNRRGFEKELLSQTTEVEEERRGSERKGQMSMIFIDVDDFKSINDTYGHEAGNEVLRTLAQIVMEEARVADTLMRLPEAVAGRMGGDEIVIALPGADEEGARRVLERISRRVEAAVINTPRGQVKFAISGGVGKDIERADERMYGEKEKKHAGQGQESE